MSDQVEIKIANPRSQQEVQDVMKGGATSGAGGGAAGVAARAIPPGIIPSDVKTIELPDGRIVGVREPSGNSQFRALMIIPPELATNQLLLANVHTILYVVSLDGKPVATPQTFLQVQGIADQLGNEGLAVLNMELQSLFPISDKFRDKLNKHMEAAITTQGL